MKATAVQTEVTAAAARLRLTPEQFRQLADTEAEPIYRMALDRFVTSPFEPRWWWEHLREPSAGFRPEGVRGFELIPSLVPEADASIYFVAEDDSAPFYPVYLTTARLAGSILADCSHFEYYLFPPDFSWLIGENHHQVIFGGGEPIVSTIKARSHAAENG